MNQEMGHIHTFLRLIPWSNMSINLLHLSYQLLVPFQVCEWLWFVLFLPTLEWFLGGQDLYYSR